RYGRNHAQRDVQGWKQIIQSGSIVQAVKYTCKRIWHSGVDRTSRFNGRIHDKGNGGQDYNNRTAVSPTAHLRAAFEAVMKDDRQGKSTVVDGVHQLRVGRRRKGRIPLQKRRMRRTVILKNNEVRPVEENDKSEHYRKKIRRKSRVKCERAHLANVF